MPSSFPEERNHRRCRRGTVRIGFAAGRCREPWWFVSAVLRRYVFERSTPSTTNELTPVAGTSCGIAREGDTVNYFDTTYQLETCVTANDLPTEEDVDDLLWGQTTTAGTRDEVLTSGGGLPILDRELPLP